MRKSIGIILVSMFSLFILSSATKGISNEIEFEHFTLKEAKALAAETGKPIFIDCYTLWCGPCKRMAATSFKDDRVASFYNKNFINLKVEMEKDADGPEIARRYQIRAYPTLLIIDHQGKLIEQRIGMQSADGLLSLGRAALK